MNAVQENQINSLESIINDILPEWHYTPKDIIIRNAEIKYKVAREHLAIQYTTRQQAFSSQMIPIEEVVKERTQIVKKAWNAFQDKNMKTIKETHLANELLKHVQTTKLLIARVQFFAINEQLYIHQQDLHEYEESLRAFADQ